MKKIIINTESFGLGWTNKAIVEILHKELVPAKFEKIVNGKPVRITKEEFASLPDYEGRAIAATVWDYSDGVDVSLYRCDEDAIAVLEEFGSDFCSGEGCHLVVKEYDDDLFDPVIEENPYGGEDLVPKLSIAYDKAMAMSKEELITLLRQNRVVRPPRRVLTMEKS